MVLIQRTPRSTFFGQTQHITIRRLSARRDAFISPMAQHPEPLLVTGTLVWQLVVCVLHATAPARLTKQNATTQNKHARRPMPWLQLTSQLRANTQTKQTPRRQRRQTCAEVRARCMAEGGGAHAVKMPPWRDTLHQTCRKSVPRS